MMEPSFEKLLVLLASNEVQFVVVGGIAVTLQGYVRLTEDVDFLLEDSESNITRLLDALKNYGEGFAQELTVADFDDSEGAIRIIEEMEHCQMDIFTRMSGLRYADLARDADTLVLRGFDVMYASKKSLIHLKENSVRDKDKLDAMALRQLLEQPRSLD